MSDESQSNSKPATPILFSDIDTESVKPSSDVDVNVQVDEESGGEDGETDSEEIREDDVLEERGDLSSTDARSSELEPDPDSEDEELEEDDDGDEEEEGEALEDASSEYFKMSKGGLSESLSKLSGKELDRVLSDVQIPVRADGQDLKVSLSELRRSYASKASTTKEYYQVKEWKDKIEAEFHKIDQAITPAWNALKEKKIEQSLIELAKVVGYSKLEVKRRLREELAEEILSYSKMTPEQRKYFELEEEVAFNRQSSQEKTDRDLKAREITEREQTRYRFQAQHGISNSKYDEATQWLLKNRLNGDASKLTAEGVLDYISTSKAVDSAMDLIERERPSLRENEVFVDRVVRLCKKYPEAPMSQLSKKIQQIAGEYGSKKGKEEIELKKGISRKVLKTKQKSALQNPNKQKPKARTFDDILL